MRKVFKRLNKTAWSESDKVGTVTLPFDDRHRRRIRMTDDAGEPFMLELSEAEHLHDGDGLELENGFIIEIQSAIEAVLDIECQDTEHAARVAWHIGNRHIPLQVLKNGHLRIGADHVLAEMLKGLGAKVMDVQSEFSPESGAYASGGHGHHDH
ncbi:MAG: urease accessory protein UreE [Rhodospirillales bacterium]|jgi:urease accessory protein|tara:strand:+ start:9791 stop:10252 length:462 start_codon:yes stop_codon:yes gene_type:complete